MRQLTQESVAGVVGMVTQDDLILAVDEGRIVERGTHTELIAHDGLYARLYTEQFAGGKIEARCRDGVRFRDGHTLRSQPAESPAA